ncbi:hypothetical protein Sjap_005710 [Stephania japonica]|uniref:Uncharacterized protein n=1 Tax=Stephania japonica TaxID=461633 RepID=A0AAP0PJ28_9MAGN
MELTLFSLEINASTLQVNSLCPGFFDLASPQPIGSLQPILGFPIEPCLTLAPCHSSKLASMNNLWSYLAPLQSYHQFSVIP